MVLMTVYQTFAAPFVDYGFMRRALLATMTLGLGSGSMGVLLLIRRMSLMGDAMSHAVLPGAAIGFLLAGGLSLPAMGLGGVIAGLSVALLSGLVTRSTVLREDASFASFYLTSLALGVLIVSLRGSNIDLLHVLFGTILAIDNAALYLVGGITTASLLVLAVVYRPLILECFDPAYLRLQRGHGAFHHVVFLFLVVLNLVAGFQALGTLMAVGMMTLPAAVARLWGKTLPHMFLISVFTATLSGYLGLVVSYHWGLSSGPTMILLVSLCYAMSLVFAPQGFFYQHLFHPHRVRQNKDHS
jgi:zinc/manganese transport system permease protein